MTVNRQIASYNENFHPTSRARRNERVSERRASRRACHNWQELMDVDDICDDVDDEFLTNLFRGLFRGAR